MSEVAPSAPHGLRRITGRDPHETNRVSTPLELLFDLTFAVSFGLAGASFAHELAQGTGWPAVGAYLVVGFAILWAWTPFTWYASAFDNDDVAHRLLTMVQMAGVVVLALGVPRFFDSLHTPHPDNQMMVAGYVVMRVAMVGQWWRVARDSPPHRRLAVSSALATLGIQVVWVVLLVAHTSWLLFAVVAGITAVAEVWCQSSPIPTSRFHGTRTTWPNATHCWRSSRWVRASSGLWLRCPVRSRSTAVGARRLSP